MDDKKILMVAGATISGVALGFLLGYRFCKADAYLIFRKSEESLLLKYISENSSREPEVLAKLRQVWPCKVVFKRS